MTSMLKFLPIALISLNFAACGYDPPASSSFQGSTNAPITEEEKAGQPSVNQ